MTFNIAFFADAHIDYASGVKTDESGVNLRVKDGYRALETIIRDIIKRKDEVDAVVMGGDMFHTSHPSIRGIMVVQELLRELARAGISIDILAGNHDATDDRSYPAAVGVLDDPERGIYAHYKPYVTRELADGVVLHSLSHHGLHKDDAPEIIAHDGVLNIFTTHGAAVDPDNAGLMHCLDSPREQVVNPDIIVSDAFDLRLLGHFHSRVPVGDPALKTWYAGSTLRRGFSDAEGARGWSLFKVHNNGDVDVEHYDIPQRPQYDFEVIDALGMSGSEVTELIIENLKSTRESDNFTAFDNDRAPILRQKIINIPTSTRQGLDRKEIARHAQHALEWQYPMEKPEHVVTEDTGEYAEEAEYHADNVPAISAGGPTLDVVASYQGWADDSQVLGMVQKPLRPRVREDASEHLKRAQEAEMDNASS